MFAVRACSALPLRFSLYALLATGAFVSTGCADTTLRPAFTSIEGLPATLTPPDPPLSFSFAVRNVGEGRVTIGSVEFTDNADDNFFDLTYDLEELLSTEQMVVRFNYQTPDGNAQGATLVIESDATQNPTLEVPVETAAYVAVQPHDAGPEGDDAGTEPTSDAGSDANDAGPDVIADAGVPDSGN